MKIRDKYEVVYDSIENCWKKSEFFIINNPPDDTLELMMLVSSFNEATMGRDTILKYVSGYVRRVFFKNTRKIRKLYNYTKHNDVYIEEADYTEDKLLFCDWRFHNVTNTKIGVYWSFVEYIGNATTEEEFFYPWRSDSHWRKKELNYLQQKSKQHPQPAQLRLLTVHFWELK